MNRRLAGGIVIALSGGVSVPAFAQSCHTPPAEASTVWAPPLDRKLALHARDVSLRDALDRVSVAARVHLAYSTEFLPLDRVECITSDSAQMGDVLSALLHETTLTPVSIDSDQVVLAPRIAGNARLGSEVRAIGMLDRVIITGTASGGPERRLTVGLDVINGPDLVQHNATTLADVLSTAAPGVWTWPQSPTSLFTSYASVRGASSFGVSYPKIYIDGIEVANPLLVSRFNTTAIDRIEVIRGPQESALYGTDAISGVINIITKHEGADAAGENGEVHATAGVASSDFTSGETLTQEHALEIRSGTNTRSAGLDVSASTMGNYIPDGDSRAIVSSGSTRWVGSKGSITGTARFVGETAGSGVSPLLRALRTEELQDSTARGPGPGSNPGANQLPTQTVDEYTLGVTGLLAQNDRWTHSLTAGIDGYRLWDVAINLTPVSSAVDTAIQRAQGGADRTTLRLSSVAHFGADEGRAAKLTFSAEQAALYETNNVDIPLQCPGGRGACPVQHAIATSWSATEGVTAQGEASIDNTFFGTAGLRFERNDALSADQNALLPMIGGAVVGDHGPLTLKVRAAYGKGIRPPSTSTNATIRQPYDPRLRITLPALAPEEQSGIEAGVDVQFERLVTLQVTGYDQLASGLIEQVPIVVDSARRMFAYPLENVGSIINRGLEASLTAGTSSFSVGATFAGTYSKVRDLAAGYNGALRPGDRALDVPALTASLQAAWHVGSWHLSGTASRAFNWIDYDRLALATAYVDTTYAVERIAGTSLRNYWRRYDGKTHLNLTGLVDLPRGFALELSALNLFNQQVGEPDNVTVVPGRTFMTGLRKRF